MSRDQSRNAEAKVRPTPVVSRRTRCVASVMPNANRLALIGLDAFDIGFASAHRRELPFFDRWFEQGAVKPLTSCADVFSSAVWPSFATGATAGEVGIYYPMQWDRERMALRRVDAGWTLPAPFWAAAARAGKRVIVLDAPFALPSLHSSDSGSIEVLNWGSQETLGPFVASPPSIASRIRREFGRHPMGRDVPAPQSAAALRALRERLVAGAATKARLAIDLMGRTPFDLFLMVFAESHRAGHVLWPTPTHHAGIRDEGELLAVYVALDRAVADVHAQARAAGADVVVFSLHGMQPNYTQEHFLPQILDRINRRFYDPNLRFAVPSAAPRGIVGRLRAAVPPSLQAKIADRLPEGVRDWVVNKSFCGALEWSHTPAFALVGSCEGYLRINRRGRERDGILDSGSAEEARYLTHLRAEFAALHDADSGQAVVREIVDVAARFPGARSDRLPDLVVSWAPIAPARRLVSPNLGEMHAELATGRTGDHRAGGFVAIDGAAAAHAAELRDATDFAGFVGRALERTVQDS
jgi:predicted AlkP superfamily phosphohydrolase/phosphomutase